MGQNYWCPLPGHSGGLKESQLSSNMEKLNVNVSGTSVQNAACGSEDSVAQRRLVAVTGLTVINDVHFSLII